MMLIAKFPCLGNLFMFLTSLHRQVLNCISLSNFGIHLLTLHVGFLINYADVSTFLKSTYQYSISLDSSLETNVLYESMMNQFSDT